MKLRPEEHEVRGVWREVDGRLEADENCRRIEELVQRHPHEVARDSSGWIVLYQDPEDGRYWELTYDDGGAHGGGPPRLTNLSKQEAREKYGSV